MTNNSADPRPAFIAMFGAVRAYLLGGGRTAQAGERVATNPKGEATRAFDAEAERIALEVANRELGAFRALSEEIGEVTVGSEPQWTLILDPCDGSNNFRRGIRSVGFAVGALPFGASLDPANVAYAVCGDIFTGTLYSAARGEGATVDGRPCHTSAVQELRHAMLGVNIGRARSPLAASLDETTGASRTQQVWQVMGAASTIRRTGATVLDLCYVAQGAYDAYVDLRERLTPENFLAPALILEEAGGKLVGGEGQPLGSVEFTRPYSVLAVANPTLLSEILAELSRA
ncbi:MAG: inositol monophosphatase family protein [Ktedonobacterales bacterium]